MVGKVMKNHGNKKINIENIASLKSSTLITLHITKQQHSA